MVYKFFDRKKKTSGSGIKNKIISNKELAEESHKAIARKFNKRRVQSSFINSIWSNNLTDMQLKTKLNKL